MQHFTHSLPASAFRLMERERAGREANADRDARSDFEHDMRTLYARQAADALAKGAVDDAKRSLSQAERDVVSARENLDDYKTRAGRDWTATDINDRTQAIDLGLELVALRKKEVADAEARAKEAAAALVEAHAAMNAEVVK